MNDIDFIKKCVPFAEEFEIDTDVSGDEILCHENDFNLRSVYLDCAHKSVEFEHLLTVTIEGITNQWIFQILNPSRGLLTVNNQDGNLLNEIYFNPCNKDEIISSKMEAIQYVFEQMEKSNG